MYTTASVLLKTLADVGVTHIFANWGNDHPAILEDLERQRTDGGGKALLDVVTCPNEMVALSAAHGYSQVTGKPAAVIVHVDVGTQALAGAVHNADKGQAPVIIFAGASPFSVSGEHKGSKNEWPMWGQDAPDQPAIVRQFMRFTAQIMSGKTVAKTVMRAWQFATSSPKGPVYLWARRETLQEEIDPSVLQTPVDISKWPSVQPSGLSPTALNTIVDALTNAEFPLIIAGNTGRNPQTVSLLATLSNLRSIAVCTAISPALCVPYSHPYLVGSSFDGRIAHLEKADVVLIIEADVPWMDTMGSKLVDDTRVFVLDVDPLKQQFGWSHVDAEMLCRVDSAVALGQLINAVRLADLQTSDKGALNARMYERGTKLRAFHEEWMKELLAAEEMAMGANGTVLTVPYVLRALRKAAQAHVPSGNNILWLNEGISNCDLVWNHIQPEYPGSMIMSGGSSLGWALGAAVGARLGAQVAGKDYELIVAVVGDGDFLFGVPSAAYWMARRYKTPFLTVILNNGGWASPRYSMLGMYPNGVGSKATGQQLNVSFGPDMPDYAQIAAAAGDAWGRRVASASELQSALEEGIRAVVENKRSAVVDCILEQI
ncbi:thiamine diphosphate-binding protein [Laetiporus sulphureus 93-53]|uniref:Thiamin diphosphate-binding protein n=1 Tax=Laetiporus sulphureus 93-53 TaxID=1314785 RepID=A0A165HV68_9APHY|nr:thiamine diphosphate-binding protein [Laetiporus sulphureus 93-53]KZT12231.1 Thiamin diphosphate-binding protein [Laetiporus sulphureus 93-53]